MSDNNAVQQMGRGSKGAHSLRLETHGGSADPLLRISGACLSIVLY